MKFKTGDLVYATRFREMGVGIVTEFLDHDVVSIYWFGDGIVMSSGLVSIKKAEVHNNEV